MKLVVFTDLHMHNYRDHSIVAEGVNSRLVHTINIITQIKEFCRQRQVNHVAFLGDLLHSRGHVSVEVFNAAWHACKELSHETELLMIAGNHDYAGGTRSCVLEPFTEFARVITVPQRVLFAGLDIFAVPHREGPELQLVLKDLPDSSEWLLGHFGVIGAVVGSHEYSAEDGIDPITLSEYKQVVLGHFHRTQWIRDNILFAGSPLQHNMGDLGKESGFYYFENENIEFVKCNAPSFLRGVPSELKDVDVRGNFLELILGPGEDAQRLTQLLHKRGAASVMVTMTDDPLTVARIDVKVDAPLPDMVAKYVDYVTSSLSKQKLLQVGLQVVNEASEGNVK